MTRKEGTPRRPRGSAQPGRAAASDTGASLDGLYFSPEFLIRRAHQVASATFAEVCRDLDLTTSQYAVMFALRQHGQVSQNELGRLVALDRATTAVVVKSLRERSLLETQPHASDRRKVNLSLTNAGRLLLGKAEQLSAKSGEMLLSALGAKDSKIFLSLLQQLADSAGWRSGER